MNNLKVLGDSVRDTLGRLRDKQAFLHQHKRYYLDVRNRLLELDRRDQDEEEEEDQEEKIAETGLEFNDIIISTKKRIFVSIGYEYFVERDKEEAAEFAEDKLRLISEAIIQFDSKIQEAELTERRINELSDKGDELEDEFPGDEEEGLPAMEIREELDDDGNVISSTVTPSGDQKTRKELEHTMLGENDKSNEQRGLSDFEKNLKGKLVQENEKKRNEEEREKQEQEQKQNQEQEQEQKHKQKEEQAYQYGSGLQIDMENMYTFDDLVREMEERDQLEDQLDDVEYLRSEDEEEAEEDDYDDDDDDGAGYTIVPGEMARGSFMEQIRKLRRDRMSPPKSILKSKDKNSKSKKSVGFAENASVHEVENLKEVNKSFRYNPLLQIDDDGSVLTSEEFDGELFTKLIGVQGPDEIHEKYKPEVEIKEKQEQERAQSKKRVSRFKLERVEREKNSDLSEASHDASGEKEGPMKENPVSDLMEKTFEDEESVRKNPVSDVMERDFDNEEPVKENPVSDIVERDFDDEESIRENPVSNIVEKNFDDEEPARESPVSDIVEKNFEDQEHTAHPPKKHILKKPLRSLYKPKRKSAPQQRPRIEELDSDEEETEKSANADLLSDKHDSDPSPNFPPEIQKAAMEPHKPMIKPIVDYRLLSENLDDMAKAYSLGIYDDDIDDDPGTLVEKLDDFKNYNKEVENLEDDIREFRLNNPQQEESNNKNNNDDDDDDDDNAPMMTDVVENDLPDNYDDVYDENEDLSLHPDKLNESIAIDYHRLKTSLMQERFAQGRSEQEKQIEPIDEWGNPIKPSRFNRERFGL